MPVCLHVQACHLPKNIVGCKKSKKFKLKKMQVATFVVGTASDYRYQGSSNSLQQKVSKKKTYTLLQDIIKLADLRF